VAICALIPLAARAQGLEVAEAKLGKGVQDREIVEETATFAVNDKAYLWLRVTGGTGAVKVTWTNGDFTDSVPLEIGGSPWRTWATKTVWRAGEWKVTVTDSEGNPLKEVTFQVL
jgi:hypothetical protein